MSGLSLTLEYHNIDLPAKALQQMANSDTAPLMDDVGDYVLSETLLNFDNEQTPAGEPWQPSLRAIKESGKTLQDTGRLRDSYVYESSRDRVEIGSNLVYAAIHHFGGDAGRNHSVTLVPRPALGITGEMEREIGDMALDFYRRNFEQGAAL